jgi:hypothetical protein
MCGSVAKAKIGYINLPLNTVLEIDAALQDERIDTFLRSKEFSEIPKEENLLALVLKIKKLNIPLSSDNLGSIYSALPSMCGSVAKAKIGCINLRLNTALEIREVLQSSESEELLNSNTFSNLAPGDRFLRLMQIVRRHVSGLPNNKKCFSAFPHQLSDQWYRADLSTDTRRLKINDKIVFFDSIEERVIGGLLHFFGLVENFIEGENLHLRVGDKNKVTIDFLIGENILLEYHPLSMKDKKEGLDISQAGERKRSAVTHEKFEGCDFYHIWSLKGFYELLQGDLRDRLPEPYQNMTWEEFTEQERATRQYAESFD